MRPPIFVCSLSNTEKVQLETALRSKDAFVMRRAQIILASEICRRYGCGTGPCCPNDRRRPRSWWWSCPRLLPHVALDLAPGVQRDGVPVTRVHGDTILICGAAIRQRCAIGTEEVYADEALVIVLRVDPVTQLGVRCDRHVDVEHFEVANGHLAAVSGAGVHQGGVATVGYIFGSDGAPGVDALKVS